MSGRERSWQPLHSPSASVSLTDAYFHPSFLSAHNLKTCQGAGAAELGSGQECKDEQEFYTGVHEDCLTKSRAVILYDHSANYNRCRGGTSNISSKRVGGASEKALQLNRREINTTTQ